MNYLIELNDIISVVITELKTSIALLSTCDINIISIHLDEVTNPTDAQSVIESTSAFPDDTKNTVILFASPQVLIDKDN